ncbi:MAG: hypothetical protein U0793_21680 [Gemmataceae bacterium]
MSTSFGARPMTFEINRGQADSQVQFLSHGKGYNLFLSRTPLSSTWFSRTSSRRRLRVSTSFP